MRNKLRDSLVSAFTEELLKSGLSQRNAFYFATEKYIALKKLYWLPNQQHVERPGSPPSARSKQCRVSTSSRKKSSPRRNAKQKMPSCGGTSACTALADTTRSAYGTGPMSRLENLETCLEFSTLVFSVFRCLSGLGRARAADATVPQQHESALVCRGHRRRREQRPPQPQLPSASVSSGSVAGAAAGPAGEESVQSDGAVATLFQTVGRRLRLIEPLEQTQTCSSHVRAT
jgi:hypothetical protein